MSPATADAPAGSPSRLSLLGRSATRSLPLKSVSSTVMGSSAAKSRAACPSPRSPPISKLLTLSLILIAALSVLGAVLIVVDVVQPSDDLAVLVGLLHGDVCHVAVGCRTMPVLFARFDGDDVSWADL